jgi:hypothetical protein
MTRFDELTKILYSLLPANIQPIYALIAAGTTVHTAAPVGSWACITSASTIYAQASVAQPVCIAACCASIPL